MQLSANINAAARSLYGAKQRTLLALIGIVIGIGSVIAMISVGTIVEQESLRQFKDMGTEIVVIRKGYAGSGPKRPITLRDVEDIPSFCPSIEVVAPYIQASLETMVAGKADYGPMMGVTRSFAAINKMPVLAGRFISDFDEFSYFCVLGSAKAAKLERIGLRDPVGKKLRAGDHIYTIIGVLDHVPQGGMRPFGLNDSIFIPISTATRIVERAEITDVMARMKTGVRSENVKNEINAYFQKKIRGIRMEVNSAEELIEQMEKQMRLFTLLLGSVGSISLVVGGVGVMNVMLVSVAERKKEIGIRRALGAKRRDIQGQFLIESLFLSFVGGIFGILLGVGASYIIARVSDWQFMVSYLAVTLGFGVSSVVGIFFGFYPARQASRLDPITALRSD